jgi:4-hydroxy-tetrahydrodipicolinate reductase
MASSSETPLQIALVGTGRMGQAVEAAVARGGRHAIVARFDEENPLLDSRDPEVLQSADVVIDFTSPEIVLDHIHRYSFWGIDAVIGTTGWYDEMDRVREWVEEGQNGLLYAPNFSLGVAALVRALEGALPLLERLEEYDAFIHEVHHTGKIDSPSGTALLLGRTIIEGLSRKSRIEPETQHGKIDPSALHVTSTRAGAVFGDHTVGFDSEYDRITLRHVAKGREAFASGAVRAAEWLHGRQGLFSLDDLLASFESGS